MNYKEKYEQALERAKYYQKENGSAVISAIFPELKESEDEKIRKELISFLKSYDPFLTQKYIAWLEKQGEKSSIRERYDIIKESEWFKKTHEGMSVSEEEVDNANVIVPKDYSSIDPHFFKTTDEVEPRFKVGEWLCENESNNYARFIQILEIVNIQGKERYRISRDIHKDEDVVEFDFIEKYYHKFDIQDVKKGDVLTLNNEYFLFKGRKKSAIDVYIDVYISYCFVDSAGTFREGGEFLSMERGVKIHPATAEQRQILFDKIYEASYKWDVEKKELKKIDVRENLTLDGDLMEADNMIVESSWNEEDEKILNGLISSLARIGASTRTDSTNINYTFSKEIDWLKSLKDRLK